MAMEEEEESGRKRNRGEDEQSDSECDGSDGGGAAAKQSKSSSAAAAIVKLDLKALDCTICFDPLRPPVLQCAVGHAICSCCHGRLLNRDRCQSCAVAGGYNRCFVVDHILWSVRVPCSNAAHGCAAETAYHEAEEHERECPHAPCFCPEAGCGFAGPTDALAAHLADEHQWASGEITVGQVCVLVVLDEGTHLLRSRDDDDGSGGGALFLVKFTPAPPFGTAISVFRIEAHPAAAAAAGNNTKFKCCLDSPRLEMGWLQRTRFHIRSTDLSDGLPPVNFSSVVVPGVTPTTMYITIIEP